MKAGRAYAILALFCALLAGCTAASETVAPGPAPAPPVEYTQVRAQQAARAQIPEGLFSPFQYRDLIARFYVEHGVPVSTAYVAVSTYRQDASWCGMGDTIAILARTEEGQPADFVYLEGDSSYVKAELYPGITWIRNAGSGLLLVKPDILNAEAYQAWQQNAEAMLNSSPYAEWQQGISKSKWGRGWRELLGLPLDQ